MIALTAVREDPAVQLRDGLDMDRVQAMIEFEEEGGKLPPITVVGDDNLLGDGHHRLAAARRSGRIEIEANRIAGGMPEAVVAAICGNDISTHQPLNRAQRNAGVKMLLDAGWSMSEIGRATGVSEGTVRNITNSRDVQRALPPVVAEKLNDTTLARIATLPKESQVEFATAVAEAGITEPRVREAIKSVNEGMSPTDAVWEVAPITRPRPVSAADVAKQAIQRIERFTVAPMLVNGTERDFWEALEVLAQYREAAPLEVRSLSRLLADLAVKADRYSSILASDAKAISR